MEKGEKEKERESAKRRAEQLATDNSASGTGAHVASERVSFRKRSKKYTNMVIIKMAITTITSKWPVNSQSLLAKAVFADKLTFPF